MGMRKSVVVLAASWTLVIVVVGLWGTHLEVRAHSDLAHSEPHRYIANQLLVLGLFWLIGLSGIALGATRVRRRVRERDEAEAERMRAERVLREGEERYRAFFDNALVGLFRSRMSDGLFTQMNSKAAAQLGLTVDEVVGKVRAADLYRDSEQRRELLAALQRDGEAHGFDVDMTLADGRDASFSISVRANPEEDYMEGAVVDVTERKLAERQRAAHLRLLESMEHVDRAIHQTDDIERMMSDVLQTTLDLFDADRAWLAYPCDPDAQSWRIPMMRTRPGYDVDEVMRSDAPTRQGDRLIMRAVLDEDGPVGFGPVNEQPLPEYDGPTFGVRAMLITASHPRVGKPWAFGLHQCSRDRHWTAEERELFLGITRRLGDGLSSLLVLRDLQASEEKWRSLTMNSPDHVMLLDCDGTVRFINYTVAGDNPEDVVGTSVFDYIPESSRQRVAECLAGVVTSHQPDTYETDFHTADGDAYYFESRVAPAIEKGETVALILVSRDVTERKRADAAALENEARLQTVLNSSADYVMMLDRDHRVLFINRVEPGVELDSVIGRPLYEIAPPDDRARVKNHLDRALHEGIRQQYETPFDRPDGTSTHFSSIAVPLVTSGEISGTVVSSRDVTDLKRAEREKLMLQRQVQHAQKLESLGVLAGGIAHDFNNLLMAIMGNADLALHELSPLSPARENIQEVAKIARRAAELTRQMLSYSGKGRFVIESIDLGELFEEIAHFLEVSISKKARLEVDLAENLPAFEGDATQIRQIAMNLITNASEAIGDRIGVISLSTGAMHCDRAFLEDSGEFLSPGLDNNPPAEGLYVYLEVADTGSGMDPKTVEKIFDPFFTTKFTGRGLGLSAVLGIVRGHKGTMKIDSEVGRGTTIRVLFPAIEAPEDLLAEAGKAEAGGGKWQAGGTVLIADDEEAVVAVGKQMLELMGFEVLTASDGRDALRVLSENQGEISCVLLDLTMPRMGGEEAFREIRRLYPGITVFICSGYGEMETVQRFAGEDLAGFIQKPYTTATLREHLSRVLPSTG